MSYTYTFQEFTTERVQKGKNFYEKGVCTYTSQGANKTQTIMSFSSPAVFATLKTLSAGTDIVVEVSKNDAGYNQWNSVKVAGDGQVKAAAPSTPVRTTYETPEERAKKQIYIVRQSSLAQAVASLLPGSKAALDPDTVKKLAKEYTDWVLQDEAEELQDIPM